MTKLSYLSGGKEYKTLQEVKAQGKAYTIQYTPIIGHYKPSEKDKEIIEKRFKKSLTNK